VSRARVPPKYGKYVCESVDPLQLIIASFSCFSDCIDHMQYLLMSILYWCLISIDEVCTRSGGKTRETCVMCAKTVPLVLALCAASETARVAHSIPTERAGRSPDIPGG